jgi:hypothetical protein
MLKVFLGVASGSLLYLYSNTAVIADGHKAGFYLAGMVILALTLTATLHVALTRMRASARTLAYVRRSKAAVRADERSFHGRG